MVWTILGKISFVSKIVEKKRIVIEKPIKEEILETEANTSLILLSFPNDVSTAHLDMSYKEKVMIHRPKLRAL